MPVCIEIATACVQEDFMGSEQRTLPRPPPEMKQALPTAPDAVAAFNTSMAAYYQQVILPVSCIQVLPCHGSCVQATQ